MSLSSAQRQKNIQANLRSQKFDVVIIGGGINGAGVARDAASRGLSVALVEADDFASGTSSRSSKLVHGGIRYLETFEFGLVFEALTERRRLFEMAPHLVHPLRFVLPLYEGDRVGMFKMGLGMWLYDALAMFDAPSMHRRFSANETKEVVPSIQTDGLKGSFLYFDAYMDDDRLVHETLRSAHRFGAQCVNYVAAIGAEFDEAKKVKAIRCRDALTGQEFMIRGRHFVSTVGPWTDDLASQFFESWKSIMRPSKGIHLTFRRDRFPLKDAVVMAADQQKRIIFGIPRHEMVILGTTDTDFDDRPENVHSNVNDVKYLLQIANQYFPGVNLTAKDIVASYAGVRPLVADDSTSESGTSREHIIINDSRNVTFVAGGKYTTYRAMAEETVESFLSSWSIEERVRYRQSLTQQPLNPKANRDQIVQAKTHIFEKSQRLGLSKEVLQWLADRHGLEAFDLLDRAMPVDSDSDPWIEVWKIEARHAIRETLCLNLKDFYLRRTPLFLADSNHGFQYLEEVSKVFQQELGLSDGEIQQQTNALHQHLDGEMGWLTSLNE